MFMKRYLNLNDRAFNAIKDRTKRIEIRANTNNNDYSQYEIGDIIVFNNISFFLPNRQIRNAVIIISKTTAYEIPRKDIINKVVTKEPITLPMVSVAINLPV